MRKKKILFGLVLAATVVTLGSCGGVENSDSVVTQSSNAQSSIENSSAELSSAATQSSAAQSSIAQSSIDVSSLIASSNVESSIEAQSSQVQSSSAVQSSVASSAIASSVAQSSAAVSSQAASSSMASSAAQSNAQTSSAVASSAAQSSVEASSAAQSSAAQSSASSSSESSQAVTDSVKITNIGAEFETLYAEFNPVKDASSYNVYVKEGSSSFKKIDPQLIRLYKGVYGNYYRVDVVGLKASTYSLKVVPVINTAENTTKADEAKDIQVQAYERTGFGFVNGSSSGAYNDDGTLKSNAKVIYVSNLNKNTVELDGYTGVQNIIAAKKDGKGINYPVAIRIIGNITDPSVLVKGDMYLDGVSELTIEGIGTDATLNGFGIVVKNSSNVEIRNLGFMNCDSTEGDSIGLQQKNNHVWVHDCDIFYGSAGGDKDQAKGDGALDTKTSSYITHSYNHFWDTGKSNLQGMKSESTSNYITYHHNWYDHSDSRHPRIRTCTVHVYNNYFDGISKYGVGMTMGGSAFVENNYFRSTATLRPMMISGQGTDAAGEGTFSGETGGVIKSYGNTFDGNTSFIPYSENNTSFDAYVAQSRDEVVPSSVKALSGGTTYNNFDTNSSLMYTYTVQSAADAKNTVTSYAGRIQGGDFKWIFNNEVDDADYGVNKDLKTALMNYKGLLISVQGIDGENETGETPTPDVPTELTAADVISLIELLPEPNEITKADISAVVAATEKYNSLSADEKTKVTNYSKLQDCNAAVAALSTGEEVLTFENGLTDINDYFAVTANLNSKFTGLTYQGVNYTKAIKMESSTRIAFDATGTINIIIVTDAANKKIKINGTEVTTDGNGVYSGSLDLGSNITTVTIEKKDQMNVALVKVSS